ncbi:MAG: glutamate--tRNA ligase [Deltaproteobacteria bacterium]|nr:glutamate--tRNA ligase [Candidatus Tharpellaceae bacterium]
MNKEVRLRFAPSPTGYLHIGGARTAIYNWLYAKKTGGKLILRIEDTDAERSTEESIQGILDGLRWLGVTWDEGPYFQSQFSEDHQKAARKLLENGRAYKCFCTREELEQKREIAKQQKLNFSYDGTCRDLSPAEVAAKEAAGLPYTIRLKVPAAEGAVVFDDLVYGRIEKKYADIEDFVVCRSNGQPLYLLSNAVDDARDRISHVLRGQDGLANTPKQILIYQALDLPAPQFVHMSLTLDPKRAKISKRSHGELVAVHFYREHGFLPWALVNFLVLLGWSNPESREFFSREELIEAFDLKGIKRANSIFNVQKNDPKFITDPKAISMNAHYLREMPLTELEPYVIAELEKAGIWQPEFTTEQHDWFVKTIDLIRSRYHFLTDFATLGRPYFADDFEYEEKALKKNLLKHPDLKEWLPLLADRFAALTDFSAAETERVVREVIDELDVKPGILINGMRTAVTGQLKGAGMFEILEIIGQQRVVDRLRRSIAAFS